MPNRKLFLSGFRAMLPVTTGVIPFGAVMGAVCADAHLSIWQTVGMNVVVFAGASQLAAVDLMQNHAASLVVVVTGLIINVRFLLYSAAMTPVVQRSTVATKLFCAYTLTDQGYAVMSSNESKFKNNSEAVRFYLGSTACMLISWHCSVLAGYVFGNFAPASWSLDFAVPLSFIALVIPTLKNRIYVAVAMFSSLVSLLLFDLPFKLGLVVTAILSIGVAVGLSHLVRHLGRDRKQAL